MSLASTFLKAILAAGILATAGCSTMETSPKDYSIKQTEVLIKLVPYAESKEFKSLADRKPGDRRTVYAEAEVSKGKCTVRLRNYPHFLLHELRHCFEVHWHGPDATNSEDHHPEDIDAANVALYETKVIQTAKGTVTQVVAAQDVVHDGLDAATRSLAKAEIIQVNAMASE